MVCTKTVYNYINKCLLSIKNIDLPIKTVREQNKKIIRENKKSLANQLVKDLVILKIEKNLDFGN
ncbi:hypothetical protein [Peptostreptococcus porci]|uniref:hypothetical protein n=1 Tax=Peptostreptococcus porci TaxID=2652282 RepID=UPI002A90AB07|nr:hypothetical protein [Peptostreptococcus porci]MDY5435597.1 hypothetical protein [Peptostreptococcus porci]